MRIVSNFKNCFWTIGLLASLSVQAADITGVGSSAAASLYRKWGEGYQKSNSGIALQYDPSGSSKGIEAAKQKQVDFGATDVPPSSSDLVKSNLVLLPTAITGLVPVVNLPGVRPGQLKMTGDVLSKIFMGKITEWDDPAITAINEGLKLPGKHISVITRSDGSGSTYAFSDYLSAVSKEWKAKQGIGFTINWGFAVQQAKGSAGVAAAVKGTDGGIAYVDYAYVVEQNLSDVKLQNADGRFTRAEAASFTEALMNSSWPTRGDFEEKLINKRGGGSWPLTMGTYVVMPKVVDNGARASAAANFLVWGFAKGDRLVSALAFVRLPDAVQAKAASMLGSIRDKNGEPLSVRYF